MTSKQASGLTAIQLEALCGKWPGVTRDIKWARTWCSASAPRCSW